MKLSAAPSALLRTSRTASLLDGQLSERLQRAAAARPATSSGPERSPTRSSTPPSSRSTSLLVPLRARYLVVAHRRQLASGMAAEAKRHVRPPEAKTTESVQSHAYVSSSVAKQRRLALQVSCPSRHAPERPGRSTRDLVRWPRPEVVDEERDPLLGADLVPDVVAELGQAGDAVDAAGGGAAVLIRSNVADLRGSRERGAGRVARTRGAKDWKERSAHTSGLLMWANGGRVRERAACVSYCVRECGPVRNHGTERGGLRRTGTDHVVERSWVRQQVVVVREDKQLGEGGRGQTDDLNAELRGCEGANLNHAGMQSRVG